MSRPMPAALRAAMLAAQTEELILTFIEITYGASVLRLVNNSVAIVRGGHTYSPFAFAITLPVAKDGDMGDARITIDAVDLSVITLVRSITDRATVGVVVALASDPDASPELDLGTFELTNVSYTATTVSGDLTYSSMLDAIVPALQVTPITVPGSF